MSYAPSLNAQGLYNWAARSVAELSERRAEINALNVFPVPDADTGSNMAHTMEAALEQADRGGDVAEALAIGSVRGARGNSGMVLSQVLAGVANASHDSVIDATVFADALERAEKLVDRAIAQPVEGTVITVLRAAAKEARAATAEGSDLHGTLVRVTAVARRALEQTPSQLEVLREAGVVDAGGMGLVILLDCLLQELESGRSSSQMSTSQLPGTELPGTELPKTDSPGIELLNAGLPNAGLPKAGLSSSERLGSGQVSSAQVSSTQVSSTQVSSTQSLAGRPASEQVPELEVMFFFSGEVEVLEAQLAPLGNSLVIARATDTSASVHIHTAQAGAVIEKAFKQGEVTNLRLEVLPENCAPVPKQRQLYAVAPAGPVADVFAAGGAKVIDPECSQAVAAAGDIFLPNGSACPAGPAHVVPTDSLVAGIAAMAVYDPEDELETAVTAMNDAVKSMRVAKPPADTTDALIVAARELLQDGGEQVTILSPHPVDQQLLAKRLGVEVMALSAPGIDAEVGVE
ncbi:hypothetical protein CPHO_06620 [Corynebacterium phocae]|uniref:DhaL domain-containing protein n=1 Tax=Corynebacterium phocae TaxID=161895 RepID=A0A1L7D3N5_9CORY|nr:DAK2 domain-containing protein [Corynebacterium phocae]APT92621.1 hypothetical protein CPHO_06620 [Corynebacterium phocae]KAA8724178.1 DAK2 domain-containing protein [Corynebacterium phocae]